MRNSPRFRFIAVITGVLMALAGLGLGAGGLYLASMGGSWYYILAAVGFILTGALLVVGRPAALLVYALVVIGTLAWTVYEVRFDWWQLTARGDVIFLIGVWLLMPWTTNSLGRRTSEGPPAAWRGSGLALSGSLAIAAVVGIVAMFSDYHDQPGALPTEQALASVPNSGGVPDGDWHAYGRSWRGDRYSPLAQISPANAQNLQVAWKFNTGDIRGPNDPQETTYEVTPIKVDDTVYLCTPHTIVIALDAETGQERWRYDPKIDESKDLQHLTCRGVSYHQVEDGHQADAATAGAECPKRLFLPTADARLIALDAMTGKPCPGFGDNGHVNLWTGMPEVQPGFYYSTSPPVVTRDFVIIGGKGSEKVSTREPSGVIPAYDVNNRPPVWELGRGNTHFATP